METSKKIFINTKYKVLLEITDGETVLNNINNTNNATIQFSSTDSLYLNETGESTFIKNEYYTNLSENSISGNHIVNINFDGYEKITDINVSFSVEGNVIKGSVDIHKYKLYEIKGKISENTADGAKYVSGIQVKLDNKNENQYVYGKDSISTDAEGDYALKTTSGDHHLIISDTRYKSIDVPFTVNEHNISGFDQVLDPKLYIQISAENLDWGEISVKTNDRPLSSNKNNKYEFYYGDNVEITATANNTKMIVLPDDESKNHFVWEEGKKGKIAKWNLTPIRESNFEQWLKFDNVTELTVKYDGNVTSEIGSSTDNGFVQVEQPNIFYIKTYNKYYPVLCKDVKNIELQSLSLNSFGYKFRHKGEVVVNFEEDTKKPILSVSENCNILSIQNKDEEELYTNHIMNVDMDIKDEHSGILLVTRKIGDELKEDITKDRYRFSIAESFYNKEYGIPVTFEAFDTVSNNEIKKLRVFYETTPPQIKTVSLNSATTIFKQNGKKFVKGEPKLDINVEENFGKLKNIRYYIKDVRGTIEDSDIPRISDFTITKEWKQKDNIYTINLKDKIKDGKHIVYITAEDMCGNVQMSVFGKTDFYTDNTEPDINRWIDLSEKENVWKKPTDIFKLEGTIVDVATPGGLSYTYKVTSTNESKPDCPNNWTCIGAPDLIKTSYSFEQDITPEMKNAIQSDGSYRVWLWAKDGCDNISNPKSYIYHIDGTQPEMKDFKFDVKENGNIAKRIFQRIFRFFFNQKQINDKLETVNLKVKASDIIKGDYDNGVKPELTDFALYYTTENDQDVKNFIKSISQNSAMPDFSDPQVKDVSDNVDGEYTFDLKIPQNEKFYCIIFVAKDKAGNLSYMVPTTKDNPDLIMVDQTAPDLKFKLADGFKASDYYDGNRNWYSSNKDVKYIIDAADSGSGLFKAEFRINGENLNTKYQNYYEDNPLSVQLVQSDTYEVSTSTDKVKIADDGHYTFDVKVTDNAGNETNDYRTIYVDMDQPVITGISFQCKDKKNQADELSVKKDGYGYFFLKDTTVKVTATDFIYNGGKEVKKDSNKNEIEGSGVRYISYVMYDVDKKKNILDTIDAKPVKNSHGVYMATFTIPAGFRGQISAFATDQVGQKSIEARPKGSVLETQQEHDTKYATTTISIPDTKYKDAEGNPLYNYKPVVSLFTEDRKSGIQNINWLVKAEHIPQFESGEKVDVSSVYDPNTDKWQTNINGDTEGWKSSIDQPNKKTKANDLNLVRFLSLKHQIQVEENHFTATLRMTDNVGNQDAKVTKKVFSVDTTAPKITVEYDNNDVYNEKYYNKERKATVTVEDANFSEKDCVFTITGDGVEIGKWTHIPGPFCDGKVHSKKCKWQCVVSFVQDGDYTFAFKCKDLAGWESSYEKVDEFTIDKTLPKIHVDYDNNDVANGIYYKEARTATVHIDEHNFRADDVKITMTAADGSKQIAVPSVSGWSSNDDDRTATIHYDYDGSFTFDVEYTDLANNEAEDYQQDAFTVDLTEPEIEITGVNDKAAYSGKVVPVISCTDTNTDASKTSVALTGYKRGKVTVKPASSIIPGGVKLTMEDIPHKKDMDDIYTLEVKMEDKAGNTSEKKILYSVNRFGSNYILSDETMKMIQKGFINEPKDVVLSEINVNKLSSSTITYTLDGEVVTLKANENYSVKESGGGDSWTTYEYRINADNFEKEGRYVVSVMSKDNAGNVTDNKVKDQNIEFTVDRTPPSTVISGVTDKGQYTDSTRTITLNVADNVGVDKVIVYCNDKQIASFDRWQIEEKNGDLLVTLNSSKDWQTIKIVTLDVAGNEMSSKEMKVLLTKNLVVQWYKNRVLFFATIITLVLLIAAITLLLSKKKDKKQIEQKQ